MKSFDPRVKRLHVKTLIVIPTRRKVQRTGKRKLTVKGQKHRPSIPTEREGPKIRREYIRHITKKRTIYTMSIKREPDS